MTPEFHLFLPQLRLSAADLVTRAQAAEAAGFTGIALMDHLTPPRAEDQPMAEAMVAATWIAAHTERLVVGHLVLCAAWRHPALLARQAATLDLASGGRFELGLGSGSTPDELDAFGVTGGSGRDRVERLDETLRIVTGLWTGEPVEFVGRFYRVHGGRQLPVPSRRIPIVVGGTGPATMQVVAEHATWWNVPVHQTDRWAERRAAAGPARVSLQQVVTFVAAGADRPATMEMARRRFGWVTPAGWAVGDGPALIDRFSASAADGVERFYLWFTDFAPTATLAAFGSEVIAAWP